MTYPYSIPPNSPNVWKEEDFDRHIDGENQIKVGLDGWYVSELRQELDFTIGIVLSKIQKKWFRSKVIEAFKADPLRSVEIINAYGLSE